MALVPLDASYVDANFKETPALAERQTGTKVDVSVDALDGKVVEGVVSSVSPASGAQFSLLPPDNATGNFTKVVQRVAVRVTFPEEVLKQVPLRFRPLGRRDDPYPRSGDARADAASGRWGSKPSATFEA